MDDPSSRRFPPTPARGYGAAVLAVLLATIVRLAIDPVLGERQPFVSYYLALVLVSWAGGLGPSLLALVLGGVSGAFLFVPPARSPRVAAAADGFGLATFLVVGAAIVVFGEARRRDRRRREREAAERRRAEAELRDSEERFRQLAETIGDAFWMGDAERGRILYVSPAYEAIWGRPAAALEADPTDWLEGIHPEDRPRIEAAYRDGRVARGSYDERYRVVRPDGTTRWVRSRAFPVRDEAGRVVRIAGIVEDITAQRRAEQKARRLTALSDRATDALVVVGADGAILDANEVACEWLGYDRGRLLTLGVSDLDPAFRVEELRAVFERAEGGRVAPFEGVLRRRDGSGLTVEISGVVERFEGEPYLFAVARDISARKAADEALRRSERHFRQLADLMPQIVWTAGPDGAVEFFNGRWYEYTGLDAEESLGSDGWWSAIHPDDRDRLRAARDRAVAAGDLFEAEVRLRRRDGRYRWHLVRSAPVRDESGQSVRRFGTGTDIDDLKRVEGALRRSEERLRLALEAGRMGTWDWDLGSGRLVWSENLESVFAAAPGGFDGTVQGFLGLIHPEDRERVSAELARSIAEGSAYDCECRVLRPDGEVGWLLSKGRAFADESGRVVRMIGLGLDITARKRAEQEIAGLLQRVTSLVDNTPLAVIEWDAEFRITRWSGRAEAIFGWTAPEVLGRRLDALPLIHEEDRAEVEGRLARLHDPATTYVVSENRNVTRSGAVVECAWYNSALHDESGRLVAVLSLGLDVTERRRAERALREERERVQLVADAVPALIAYIDAEGRYRLNNRTYERWFGRPREELLGKHVREVLGEATWRERRPMVEAALSGRVVSLEAEAPHADGGTRWVSVTYTPDVGESGEVRGFVALVTDLTDRHRREQELLASEARFRQLAEAMPQIVWVVDPSGKTIDLNRHWTEYTGLPIERGLGIGWLDSVHPDDREALMARREACRREGRPYEAEFRLRDRDGRYRWHLSRGVPVRDESGRVVRWYGSSTDIDEPKRLAEALRDDDRRKDEFIATLAHELRNPLAPIRNAVRLLRAQGPPEPELMWARDVIERQVAQMARLLDDLLDVARITRGKLELRRARVRLDEVIAGAVETSRPAIDGAGHELAVALPDEPIYLDADPVRLAQVFSNLLNNAAKYTERGGHLRLSAERRGGEVVVSVEDDGIGLDAEHLGRIFEMFSQVEPALGRAQGGLGIGLSLVRGLVERHGGTVEARSAGPGLGSEFLVRLPVADAAASAAPADPPGPSDDRTAGVKPRVLIVDDNVDSARTLARLLRLEGFEARVAHDGPAALAELAAMPAEVAVLDIGLPGMDGFELARRIRRSPAGAAATLIALTGWGQDADRRRAREAGFDHHLVKPVDLDDLIRLIETVRAPTDLAGRCPPCPDAARGAAARPAAGGDRSSG